MLRTAIGPKELIKWRDEFFSKKRIGFILNLNINWFFEFEIWNLFGSCDLGSWFFEYHDLL